MTPRTARDIPSLGAVPPETRWQKGTERPNRSGGGANQFSPSASCTRWNPVSFYGSLSSIILRAEISSTFAAG